MNARQRLLSLKELEEPARVMTREALRGWKIPEEYVEQLTLGSILLDDAVIFELYVARDRPEDAIVLTSARFDRTTGQGQIEVHYDRLERDPEASSS